jgi:hypothetical protein
MKLLVKGKWHGDGELVEVLWEDGKLSGFQPAIEEIEWLAKEFESDPLGLIIGETPFKGNLIENPFTFRHLARKAFEEPITPQVGSSMFQFLAKRGFTEEMVIKNGKILSIKEIE